MHNRNIAFLARRSQNADMRRLCQMLSVLRVGDPVPPVEDIAVLIGVEPTMAAFLLDTLDEVACIVPAPEPEPIRAAA